MSLHISVQRLANARRTLLQNWTLEIQPGEIATLMGPSGCGKSSLLLAITGLLPAQFVWQGHCRLKGRRLDDLPTHQRRMGLMFQNDLLFEHLNVAENLAYACPSSSRERRKARISEALEAIEMPELASAYPSELSGGQRTRVALMRALLAEPEALLLDEPFSALDIDLRGRIRSTVFDLLRARRIPVLLVTHDMQDVADPRQLCEWPSSAELSHV